MRSHRHSSAQAQPQDGPGNTPQLQCSHLPAADRLAALGLVSRSSGVSGKGRVSISFALPLLGAQLRGVRRRHIPCRCFLPPCYPGASCYAKSVQCVERPLNIQSACARRCIAVHPTLPVFLTSSDDTLIKLWDWDKGFSCVQQFEGHSHFVMQVRTGGLCPVPALALPCHMLYITSNGVLQLGSTCLLNT